MEKTIIISSAKLVSPKSKMAEGKHLEVSYTETTSQGTVTVTQLCTANPHSDLRNAFKKLSGHIADLTDQYDEDGNFDTKSIDARAFSISGEGEKESVILTGVRELSSGKTITINTPLERLNSESENAYHDLENLNKCIIACKEEVRQYVFEGKHADDPQGSLFEEETKELTEA